MKITILLTALSFSMTAAAGLRIVSISDVHDISAKNGLLMISVSVSAGTVKFQIVSDDAIGETRMNVVRDGKLRHVTPSSLAASTSLGQSVAFEVHAEDLCVGATSIGCGEWTIGRTANFRVGLDSNKDRLLDERDSFRDLAIQFVK